MVAFSRTLQSFLVVAVAAVQVGATTVPVGSAQHPRPLRPTDRDDVVQGDSSRRAEFKSMRQVGRTPSPPAVGGAWCPRYHTISGHYDPSGPIYHGGLWHVFPDGGASGKWSHYSSTDLLRWTKQSVRTLPQTAVYPTLGADKERERGREGERERERETTPAIAVLSHARRAAPPFLTGVTDARVRRVHRPQPA